MEIERKEENGTVILSLTGRLDATTSPLLEQKLKDEFEKAEGLILDLAKLEYVSSSGLRLFLIGYKSMKGNGKAFELINATPIVSEVLDMTGLSSLLSEK